MIYLLALFPIAYFYTFFIKNLLTNYQEKINKKINIEDTIYFISHFFLNMYCVYNCWTHVINSITNPMHIYHVPANMAIYSPLLHVYHIFLCNKKIKLDEWLHHLWVFIICPIISLNYVNLSDTGMFFMTGLPGGITYLLLILKNLNLIEDLTEKKISTHLNMWIRAPGCILTSYLIFINNFNNNFGNPNFLELIGLYIIMLGTFVNGIYFASTIIESYGIAKYKKSIN